MVVCCYVNSSCNCRSPRATLTIDLHPQSQRQTTLIVETPSISATTYDLNNVPTKPPPVFLNDCCPNGADMEALPFLPLLPAD